MIRWPWQKRPEPTPEWARQVVATIPAEQLADHLLTFAEQAVRDRNPERRAQHLAKHRAACERAAVLIANPIYITQFQPLEATPEEQEMFATLWREGQALDRSVFVPEALLGPSNPYPVARQDG